jgi:3'-phosphoadenosine 5'-phosphosulfate sulfotransferase (PAPS reductase)/FAD synthetase
MNEVNFINVSGGKDSTAVLLLALEMQPPNMRFVFADTGHEHPEVYRYLDYLERELGVSIERLRNDFTDRLARRRKRIEETWEEPERSRALEVMHATGNPFLDLCLWKGIFPSNSIRICTQFLKVEPINKVQNEALDKADRVVTWLGIRKDESASRSTAVTWEREFGPEDQPDAGLWKYRPILDWTAADVFDFIHKKGLQSNPLYRQGMGRVGCMPCIMARKSEIAEIANRFPEEIDRVERWEAIVNQSIRKQNGTFIAASRFGYDNPDDITSATHGIRKAVEWAKTSRGGRQFGLDFESGGGCSSIYGLCETGDNKEDSE